MRLPDMRRCLMRITHLHGASTAGEKSLLALSHTQARVRARAHTPARTRTHTHARAMCVAHGDFQRKKRGLVRHEARDSEMSLGQCTVADGCEHIKGG